MFKNILNFMGDFFIMIIGYARISTKLQSLDIQVKQLEAFGCTCIFKEQFTGTKKDRPELKKCLEALHEGDTLVVTKLDRLARNTTDGIEMIDHLFSIGVKVHVINIGVLENSTMGRFFVQAMLAVAEMERNMILERIHEGMENAKSNPNIMLGRPKKFKQAQIEHALELLKDHSFNEVQNLTGISVSTLQRAKRKKEVKDFMKCTDIPKKS